MADIGHLSSRHIQAALEVGRLGPSGLQLAPQPLELHTQALWVVQAQEIKGPAEKAGSKGGGVAALTPISDFCLVTFVSSCAIAWDLRERSCWSSAFRISRSSSFSASSRAWSRASDRSASRRLIVASREGSLREREGRREERGEPPPPRHSTGRIALLCLCFCKLLLEDIRPVVVLHNRLGDHAVLLLRLGKLLGQLDPEKRGPLLAPQRPSRPQRSREAR